MENSFHGWYEEACQRAESEAGTALDFLIGSVNGDEGRENKNVNVNEVRSKARWGLTDTRRLENVTNTATTRAAGEKNDAPKPNSDFWKGFDCEKTHHVDRDLGTHKPQEKRGGSPRAQGGTAGINYSQDSSIDDMPLGARLNDMLSGLSKPNGAEPSPKPYSGVTKGNYESDSRGKNSDNFVMRFESLSPDAFDEIVLTAPPLEEQTEKASTKRTREEGRQERGVRRPALSLLAPEGRIATGGCMEKKRRLREALDRHDDDATRPSEGRYPWMKDRRDISGRWPSDPGYDATTIHIPDNELAKMKPFARQFWSIKSKRMDLVLFVKHGSFYNLFDIDCDIGMRVGLNLSGKKTVNMWKCGCMKHVFDEWASRVLRLGLSVGRVEEIGEAAKGQILRRELVEVLTPGTASREKFSSERTSAPLFCISENGKDSFGVCILDALTARISYGEFADDSSGTLLKSLISAANPSEFIFEERTIKQKTVKVLKTHRILFTSGSQEKRKVAMTVLPEDPKKYVHLLCSDSIVSEEQGRLSCQVSKQISNYFDESRIPFQICKYSDKPLATASLLSCVRYLEDLNIAKRLLPSCIFSELPLPGKSSVSRRDGMFLDERAIRHLELLEGGMGNVTGSLFHFLDKTASASGQRLLREWIRKPLMHVSEIEERLDTMEFLSKLPSIADRFQREIADTPDFERLLPRCIQILACASGRNNLEDRITEPRIGCVEGSLHEIDISQGKLSNILQLLESLGGLVDAASELFNGIERKSRQSTPKLLSWFADTAARASLSLSELIPLFKIDDFLSSNKGEDFAPSPGVCHDYDIASRRVQIIEERLNSMAKKSSSFSWKDQNQEDVEIELEEALLERKSATISFLGTVYAKVSKAYATWLELSHSMGTLDILIGFGKIVIESATSMRLFSRPEFLVNATRGGPELSIIQGWHPLLSYYLPPDEIVQNDIKLGSSSSAGMMLLTGPNMGGKSTLLRLSAICVILAQIGFYVPAREMKLTLFDRIFTRMGAEDRIIEGFSTFEVEMNDTSIILNQKTRNSLVIIDELGRGTSTFDGTAIAHATLKFLCASNIVGLFSTHLIDIYNPKMVWASPFHMQLDPHRSNPTYKLAPGFAPYGSCGISLASRAGIPKTIVHRAVAIHNRNARSNCTK